MERKKNFRISRDRVKNHFNELQSTELSTKKCQKGNYWDDALDELNSLHVQFQEIRYRMSPTKDDGEKYTALKKNYRKISDAIDDLKSEREMLFDALRVSSMEGIIDHVKSLQSENQMLKSELSNSYCENERLSIQIKRKDSESNAETDSLKEKLTGLEEEYQSQTKTLLDVKAELAKLQKQKAKAKLLLKKAETSQSALKETISAKNCELEESRKNEKKLRESIAQLKLRIEENKSEMERADKAAEDQTNKMKHEIASLRQKLADTESECEKLRIEKNTLSASIRSKNETITSTKAENDKLNTEVLHLRDKETECEKLTERIRSLTALSESKDDKIVGLMKTITELTSELQILQVKDEECTRLATHVTSLKSDMHSKDDQIENLTLQNSKMKSLITSLQRAENERDEYAELVRSLNATLQSKDRELEELSTNMKLLTETREECDKLNEQVKLLQIVTSGKDDTINHITQENQQFSDRIKRLELENATLSNRIEVAAFEMESLRKPQTPQIIRNSDTDPELLRRKVFTLKAHSENLAEQIVSLREENGKLKDENIRFIAKIREQNIDNLEELLRIERDRRKGLAKLLANMVRMFDEKTRDLLAEVNGRIDVANMSIDGMMSSVSSINVSTNSTFLIQQCQTLVNTIWEYFGNGDVPSLSKFTRFPNELQKLITSVSAMLQWGVRHALRSESLSQQSV